MQYRTQIKWSRGDAPFNPKSYSRTHEIQLGNSHKFEASSAAEFAGNAQLPNPEELFSAAISSCFMLTFLYLAAVKGLNIDSYTAETVATLAKNNEGKMAVTELTITPRINFSNSAQPEAALLNELFKKSHDSCFISNSVKTQIQVNYESVNV